MNFFFMKNKEMMENISPDHSSLFPEFDFPTLQSNGALNFALLILLIIEEQMMNLIKKWVIFA